MKSYTESQVKVVIAELEAADNTKASEMMNSLMMEVSHRRLRALELMQSRDFFKQQYEHIVNERSIPGV